MKGHAFAIVALGTLSIDQMSKAAALLWLSPVPLPVFPGFNLTLGFNEGASFGILSSAMAGRPLAMAALTAAITLALLWIGLRTRSGSEAAGFALIVGGSFGNILDRVRQGAVTDFLDVFWRDAHWPTFNMADVAITCGAGLIVLSALPSRRKDSQDA